jgi:predicted secreted hydrolase
MLGLLAFTALAAAALELGQSRAGGGEPQAQLELAPAGQPAEFARALAPRTLEFPADHGPHLEYQTEWWYYIGNMQSEDGRHFGFQLTFFRRGLQPGEPDRASAFAANHIYSAHLAVTDTDGGEHRAWERFSRGAAGLAGAQARPFRVWLDDWSVEGLNAEASEVRLSAGEEDFILALRLGAERAPVAHGEAGLSQKSAVPGNASYYVSLPRMEAEGLLELDGTSYQVRGQAWFDHEWGTTTLGPQAVGWDWFGLQLEDGRELMAFQIRNRDGSIEPVSGGTLVAADGTVQRLMAADVQLQVLGTWTSPASGTAYPSGWRMVVPVAGLDLTLQPRLKDQENRLSVVYWEGAVSVVGTSQGGPVAGEGFAELTGYYAPLEGDF